MTELIKLIKSAIAAVCARVWLEEADPDASFPYVVFRLPTSNEAEHREDFILEVTIWGRGADTTTLEQLTDDIDAVLDRKKHIDANLQASFYRANRLMIPDPDPKIRRRELRYQVKTHFVS